MSLRSWAEINLENLRFNFLKIKELTGGVAFCGVVKANAYGHGSVRISKELAALGVDYLAVANIDEGIELRKSGVEIPILILGYTPNARILEVAKNNLAQTISAVSQAERYDFILRKDASKIKIHIKIDTGMNRFGLNASDSDGLIGGVLKISNLKNLEIEGVYSHFACADDGGDFAGEFTNRQIEIFEKAARNIPVDIRQKVRFFHLANSGGIVNYKKSHFDMVRSGILLYGQGEMAEKLGFKPVMNLKSKIEIIKKISAGGRVGYGGGFLAEKDFNMGIIPLGYADGFKRSLSGKYSVLLNGVECPVVGKICMDCAMIDLSNTLCSKPDCEVEVFGENNPLSEMASTAGTIPYEILCGIGQRVERVYVSGVKN